MLPETGREGQGNAHYDTYVPMETITLCLDKADIISLPFTLRELYMENHHATPYRQNNATKLLLLL